MACGKSVANAKGRWCAQPIEQNKQPQASSRGCESIRCTEKGNDFV